ncbi:MAG: TonB-dependent receptor, partial [Gemmatimonadales bacterium]
MSGRHRNRFPSMCRVLVLAAALPALGGGTAVAQGVHVSGRVVQASVGQAIEGATVRYYDPGGRLIGSAVSDASGRFVLRGVLEGVYEFMVQAFGFRAVRIDSIVVRRTDIALGDLALEPYAAEIGAMVITASRTEESLLEAPASVQLVDARTVHERPAVTVADYLRGVTGVDIVTIGLTQHSIVARGFNDVSSGSLFQLIDYRWASIPSLRFNTYNLVPVANDDIDHVELVLGPGSALYGPNVDRGVMHVVTRSPLEDEGSVVTVTGGLRGSQGGDALLDRGLVQMSGRHTARLGARTAVKVSGLYMSGNDWRHFDPQETIARQAAIRDGANPDTLRIGRRNFETSRWALDGRLDTYVGDRARLSLSAGRSHLDRSVELTPVGAAQGQNWSYTYVQGRLRSGEWFAQTYVNQSDAGGSYLLRDGSAIVDKSYIWVGQLQHATNVGSRQRFQYGADVVHTVPRTEGTINGVHENDDELTEFGGYLQSETDVTDAVRFIAAGRLDWHSVVDGPVFSPRAAVLVRPTDFHTFRLTYNRAFSQPSTQQLFLDISSSPSLGPYTAFGVRATGVPAATGFTFRRDCVGGLCMYSPFNADPSQPLPLDATGFWQDAVSGLDVVTRQFTGQPLDPALEAELRSLDPAGSVGTVLRKLDVNSQQIGPALDPASAVTDIAPLEPAITNTL